MISEVEALDYIKTLFMEEEAPGCEKALVSMGPATSFVLIGALQLATRHPEFSPGHCRMVGSVIDQLRKMFAGTPGEELLLLGDHPEFDIPRSCRYPLGAHAPGCPPGDHAGFAPGSHGSSHA